MADKGVINNRRASVTFTIEIDGAKKDVVLVPGANRLTGAQFEALRKNKIFHAMFRVTEASESHAVPDPENPGEMKVSKVTKKLPAKFREADPGELDASATKVHEGAGDDAKLDVKAQGAGKK